jgi:ferredoxin
LTIDEAACLAVASPFEACRRCAESCPTQAITLAGRRIAAEAERCVGCGRCAAVCPTEAIGVPGFAAIASGPVECARVAARDRTPGATVVPCLGGLRTVDFLESGPVPVDRGWCAGCPAGGVDAPWADAVADADAVCGWLGLDAVRVERQPLPVRRALPLPEHLDARGAARRGLFRRVTQEAPAPTVVAAVRRVEPLATVRRAAVIEARAGRPAPAALLPRVEVSEGCDANRVCVAACPTSALSVVSDTAGTGLDFDAVLCTACGVCAAACPTGAVTVTARGEGDATGPYALTRDPLRSCPECGQGFRPADGAEACSVCKNEREMAKLGFDLMRGPRHDIPSRQSAGHDARRMH